MDKKLIYRVDRWEHKIRINQFDLDNLSKIVIPLYNQFGNRLAQTEGADYSECYIHKANILGTPENDESRKAVESLEKKWEQEDTQEITADPFPMVPGEGAPQYTFDLPKDTQLSLL